MLIQLPTPAESSPSQNEASRQQKLNQHIEEQTAGASCVQGQEGQGWGWHFGLTDHQRSSAALSLLCHYITRSTSGPAPFLYQERYVSVAII